MSAAPPAGMKNVQLDTAQRAHRLDGSSISLPMGLLGFERIKRFILHTLSAEDPLIWFEVADSPGKGFYTLDSSSLPQPPVPELCQPDLEFLGLDDPADAVLLLLATVASDGAVTLHGRAPIVINPKTRVGKQVVPNNYDQLPASCVLDMVAAKAA